MSKTENAKTHFKRYSSLLEKAKGFGEIYELVKDMVKNSLRMYRASMLLFLDDLPLQLGAYH